MRALLVESHLKQNDAKSTLLARMDAAPFCPRTGVLKENLLDTHSTFIFKRLDAFSRTPVTTTYREINSFVNKWKEMAFPGPWTQNLDATPQSTQGPYAKHALGYITH